MLTTTSNLSIASGADPILLLSLEATVPLEIVVSLVLDTEGPSAMPGSSWGWGTTQSSLATAAATKSVASSAQSTRGFQPCNQTIAQLSTAESNVPAN